MSCSDTHTQVYELLASEGYRPDVASDGDLCFGYRGVTYLVIDCQDPSLVQIVYPNFHLIEDDRRIAAALACIAVSGSMKWVKLVFTNDGRCVSAVFDLYVTGPWTLDPVILRRVLDALQTAARTFHRFMADSDHSTPSTP